MQEGPFELVCVEAVQEIDAEVDYAAVGVVRVVDRGLRALLVGVWCPWGGCCGGGRHLGRVDLGRGFEAIGGSWCRCLRLGGRRRVGAGRAVADRVGVAVQEGVLRARREQRVQRNLRLLLQLIAYLPRDLDDQGVLAVRLEVELVDKALGELVWGYQSLVQVP